jgi:hypothetical protein
MREGRHMGTASLNVVLGKTGVRNAKFYAKFRILSKFVKVPTS